jgi:hypothetical protein
MNPSICRRLCQAALAVILSICSTSLAAAQTAGPQQASPTSPRAGVGTTVPVGATIPAGTTVPVGEVVLVTDTTGATTKGTLAGMTAEAVRIDVKGATRELAAGEVRRIQWQKRDSPVGGVFLGAGIGAIPGVLSLMSDSHECTFLCPKDGMLIGIGATAGGVIDHFIKRTVTVFSAAGTSSAGASNVAVVPVIARGRKGLQLAVKF